MKRIVFVVVCLALSVVSSFSYGQELEHTRCASGKYGFKDRKTGEIVIPCKYDKVWDFFSEWTAVKLNGKWGYIDKTGKEVIPLKFDNVFEFDGRVAYVKFNGKWGYSDITGTFYKNRTALESARVLALEQRERAEIEARERVARERLEKELREREASFIYFTKNYVEPKIKQWQQKGELERTVDWEQRVNETAIKAKEAELFKEAEKIFIAERSKNFNEGMMTLGAYDADNETYLIRNSIYGNWWVPVPVSEASIFRDNWNSFVKAPQFVINNDKLSIAGMTFIASNGKSYKSNFAPMNIIYVDPAAPAAPHSNQTSTARTVENVANTQETREVISTENTARTTENANKSKGTVGLRAGANFSNLSGFAKNNITYHTDAELKMKPGFQFGLISEVPFKKPNLGFAGGILYTQVGTILEHRQIILGVDVIETGKITIHSLQFRPQFQYKNKVLLLQWGLYTNYNLKADYEYKMTANGTKIDGDRESLYNSDGTAYDLGIALGAGFLIGDNCQISAGYDFGLKTSNLMVTLTLMFGK